MRDVTGPINRPSGALFTDVIIRFRAVRHNNSVDGFAPIHSELLITISALGEFTTSLLDGDYEVHVQYGTRFQPLGIIVIDPAELGTVKLGELIDQYRDATGDYSPSSLVTQNQMINYVGVGGSPADISLTAFKTNDGTALQQLRKRADNGAIEWFTPPAIKLTDVTEIEYSPTANNHLLESFHDYLASPSHNYTFPSAPSVGDWIDLAPAGDLEANPVTINLQGKNLKGVNEGTFDYDIITAMRFIYAGASYGWTF